MKSVPSIPPAADPPSHGPCGNGRHHRSAGRRDQLLHRVRLYAAHTLIRLTEVSVRLAFRLTPLGLLDRSTFTALIRTGRALREFSWYLWLRSPTRTRRNRI